MHNTHSTHTIHNTQITYNNTSHATHNTQHKQHTAHATHDTQTQTQTQTHTHTHTHTHWLLSTTWVAMLQIWIVYDLQVILKLVHNTAYKKTWSMRVRGSPQPFTYDSLVLLQGTGRESEVWLRDLNGTMPIKNTMTTKERDGGPVTQLRSAQVFL